MSFDNVLLIHEEYIDKKTKRPKMCSSQDVYDKNLLLNVPIEILDVYSNFMDLKSNVMLKSVCKRTYEKHRVKRSELNTLTRMFSSMSSMIKDLYDAFGSIEGQNRLLAGILRRLIYRSVSNMFFQYDVSYVSSRTLEEYSNIMQLTMETFDDERLSVVDFNNILEDIQFEFRGFQIVNITKERRELLDKVKSIIRSYYFSHDFTIYTYTTFGNIFLECQCDKENMMVDIHERLDNEIFGWSFIVDTLRALNTNNPEHVISKKMAMNNVQIDKNMICWKKENPNGVLVLSEIVHKLIDCSSIYKGSDDNIVEVWNDTLDFNWLLQDVVKDLLSSGMYTFKLQNIMNSVQDDFYECTIDALMILL